MKRIIVAISGASGSIYGIRLLKILLENDFFVDLMISKNGFLVIESELGIDLRGADEREVKKRLGLEEGANIKLHDVSNFLSPLASGSTKSDAMVIIPASLGLVGRIANGISSNLIERAADVCLKEKLPLCIVPREMPLSVIHLKNLLFLAELGAIIIPASPYFYHQPKTIEELVDSVVQKVINLLGINIRLIKSWDERQDLG